MFTIVNAFHCLIWVAIHYDLDLSLDDCSRNSSASLLLNNLDHKIASDFTRSNILRLEEQAVLLKSSSTFGRIDSMLNEWLTVWKRRTWRDNQYEDLAFALDPVPFWWLAKLLVLLHCGKDFLSADSEFNMVYKTGGSFRSSQFVQGKIYQWLAKLRQKKPTDPVETVESLASLMVPI
jgi:hypothetical protein